MIKLNKDKSQIEAFKEAILSKTKNRIHKEKLAKMMRGMSLGV